MTNERLKDLEQAEQLGRLKAERLDAELRAAEQREREMRLARLAWEGSGAEPPPLLAGKGGGEGGSAEVWRLRQEVERLAAFHQAVQRSRAWRLVQWARRPFGRAW